ncbi:MAG: DUF418 domain-containing protein [Alkalispirochaetaceae bacterium]
MSNDRRRIESLDLIRGVAILGILLMNIVSMAAPWVAYYVPDWYEGAGQVDQGIYVVQSLLVESRFLSLFALLFGAGLAIQTDSFSSRGLAPGRWIRRRLAWLLIFGLIHGFLIWYGDILTLYAVAGLLVSGWGHWPVRRMVVVGLALFLLGQLALLSAFLGSLLSGENIMALPELPYSGEEIAALRETWTGAFSRLEANGELFIETLVAFPLTLVWHAASLMLFGMALYRSGFFENRNAWKRALPLLAVGLTLAGALLVLRYRLGVGSSASYATMSMMMIPGILMALGYASLMVPLADSDRLLIRLLKSAGRSAFTLYIAQSVVMVALFTLVAPGLWGSLGRGALWLIVAGFSVLQLIGARIIEGTSGRGPMETLWRKLAYRKLQK